MAGDINVLNSLVRNYSLDINSSKKPNHNTGLRFCHYTALCEAKSSHNAHSRVNLQKKPRHDKTCLGVSEQV